MSPASSLYSPNEPYGAKIPVILDSWVCIDLQKEVQPGWYDEFLQMARTGRYAFSLADLTVVELQKSIHRTKGSDFLRMIDRLKPLLDPLLPILPGGKGLRAAFGVTSSGEPPDGSATLAESQVANAIWRSWASAWTKKRALVRKDVVAISRQEVERARRVYKSYFRRLRQEMKVRHLTAHALARGGKRKDLQEGLVQTFKRYSKGNVTGDVLYDLFARALVERFVSHCMGRNAYNPNGRQSKNDGLDILLLEALIIPAYVVVDGRFSRFLKNIKSPQSQWICTASELADLFRQGLIVRPSF